MARTTTVILSDDLSPEITEDVATINFALDGVSYEIDLGSVNEKKMREAFAPYVSAGRKTAGKRRASAGSGDAKEIRAWAQSVGMAVPERGRIPAAVREAFQSK